MPPVPAVVDRGEMFRRLNERLSIEAATTAVITIDCHRGHLDPEIATQPVPADRAGEVVAKVAALLQQARALGMPVIHVLLSNRWVASRPEPMHNPFWRAVEEVSESLTPTQASTISGHNREGPPRRSSCRRSAPNPVTSS